MVQVGASLRLRRSTDSVPVPFPRASDLSTRQLTYVLAPLGVARRQAEKTVHAHLPAHFFVVQAGDLLDPGAPPHLPPAAQDALARPRNRQQPRDVVATVVGEGEGYTRVNEGEGGDRFAQGGDEGGPGGGGRERPAPYGVLLNSRRGRCGERMCFGQGVVRFL